MKDEKSAAYVTVNIVKLCKKTYDSDVAKRVEVFRGSALC